MNAGSGRPSLRLIAGDLINSIAADVDAVTEAARQVRPRVPTASTKERPTHVAIIGGGIAGLTAAWNLVKERGFTGEVTIFESSPEVGGKLRLEEIEGIQLDVGAESLLATRPEAVGLAKAVGLASSIVNPTTSSASIYSYGRVNPIPAGLITGIPTDLRALAASDIISSKGLMRVPMDHWLPRTPIESDVSIGEYVSARLGDEVVERLVEPLLSGVYAGRASQLSLEMTVPALYRLARKERSLLRAARELRETGAAGSGARRGPVFAGITGGVGRLPVSLAEKLRRRGVTINTDTTVTGLRAGPGGWRVLLRDSEGARRVEADAVVLAVPATAASKLMTTVNPAAAATMSEIEYASVAVLTMLFDPDDVPTGLHGSGFLVPTVEKATIKAATYSSRKWAWVARAGASRRTDTPGYFVLRCSMGRHGDTRVLQREDSDLVRLAGRDLAKIAGFPRTPLVSRVTRWGGALPQYTVGHRARVGSIREQLVDTPGLVVCGAAYDGVGIAACVGSAQFAAGQVATFLEQSRQWKKA